MIMSLKEYRNSVLGCWMGKSIGGTLGAPMEWKRQINNVDFYTQDTGGNPLPNDDLDLQLVWLIALEEKGIDIDAATLGEYWLSYITPHWAEYGNAKVNMKAGLLPPLSGMENNPYKDSCGAFIRSEIWSCISPGCPEVAVKYACEDAKVDHGNGEGLYAEIFCAALESAAFLVKDTIKLIEIGLSYIPDDCGIARVIKLVVDAFHAGKPYLEVRDDIFNKYRAHFMQYAGISREDREKGFADGPVGWDAPANIGFIIIGLLYGEGDFEKSLCIAVNCGEDTDCTAATIGSIYGIIHGFDAIPQKWIDPIGRGIATMCLNLGELQGLLPVNIDALTDRVERVAKQVVLRYIPSLELSEQKDTDISDFNTDRLFSNSAGKSLYSELNRTLHKFDFYDVAVDYHEGPYIKDNLPKKIKVSISNKYRIPGYLSIKWYTDEGWSVSPSKYGTVFIGSWNGNKAELEFELTLCKAAACVNRCVLELTIEGRHTVMLVPIVLLNGNLTRMP